MSVARPTPALSGIVLTGGRSARFGADKAMALLDGRPLAGRVRDALVGAGAVEVLAAGGDVAALASLGLDVVPDPDEGQGPLAGVLAGLGAVRGTLVVVASCDLAWLRPETVATLVQALLDDPEALVAVPLIGDRPQWHLLALWQSAGALLEAAYVGGERALWRAFADAPVVRVPGLPIEDLRDVDEPGDLARYAAPASQAAPPRPPSQESTPDP